MQNNTYQKNLFQQNQKSQIKKLEQSTKSSTLATPKQMKILKNLIAKKHTKEIQYQHHDMGFLIAETDIAKKYIVMK